MENKSYCEGNTNTINISFFRRNQQWKIFLLNDLFGFLILLRSHWGKIFISNHSCNYHTTNRSSITQYLFLSLILSL
jgi:hypothetical protein